jgi:hypothetical protein
MEPVFPFLFGVFGGGRRGTNNNTMKNTDKHTRKRNRISRDRHGRKITKCKHNGAKRGAFGKQ